MLLTARCRGSGIASRGARSLLIVAAAGSVLVGLVPEDVNPDLHLLGAFPGIAAGNCGFILAGLIRRTSPLGRLRPLTLPLSILAIAATVLLFTGDRPPVSGAWNGLPSTRSAAGWSSQASTCCAKQAAAQPAEGKPSLLRH